MAALYDGDGNRLFTMDYTGENNDRWDIWIPECGGNADKVDDSAKDAMKELAGLVSVRDRRDYTITEYVNDVTRENEEVLAEINPRGKVTTAYTYGYNRESADVNSDTQYYLYDGKGNVSKISSEWGRVKETYNYDPYGNLTYGIPDTVNYYGYNGESSNLATGLQYLRARYYNPQTGSFLTEDTYAGQISNPLTLNRYDYVSNNPVNYVDPSGNYGIFDSIAAGVEKAWNGAKDLVSNAWNGITEFASDVWDGLTDYYNKVNAIQTQTDELERELQQIQTDTMVDGAKEAVAFVADTYKEVARINYTAQVQKQQAEEEARRAFCELLEEHETEVKVAAGTTVIAGTVVATIASGGATSQQMLGSIIGGVAGAAIHALFAEEDKADAAADGYMWGAITGALSPTIGHLVGQLGKTFTTLSTPAVAAAIEGLLETAMEEFAILMQGGEVNFGMFISDWAFNSVTSGANPQMQKLQKWFENVLDRGKNIIKGFINAIPTQEQMHNALAQWVKMEQALADSNRQLNKFNTATIVYDSGTDSYYYGMNRGVHLSGDTLNEELKLWLPESTLNQYRLGNCAEVDAINQALNAGSDINNLYIYTLDVVNNTPKKMCENCIYTFADKVAEVLSH